MNNEQLIEKAKEAIRAVHSDMSVSKLETRRSLEELVEDIEAMLDTL